MRKIIEEARQPSLRKIVDLLLFLRKKPEEIEGMLSRSVYSPVYKWSKDDIIFYRNFFWDVNLMTIQDWREYIGNAPEDYKLSHVLQLATMDNDDLLWEAGVPLAMTVGEMADAMMRECYVRFQKTKDKEKNQSLEYLKAFKMLYGVRSRSTEAERKSATQQENEVIEKVRLLLRGEGAAPEPIYRSDLVGQISDPTAMKENKIIKEMLSIGGENDSSANKD